MGGSKKEFDMAEIFSGLYYFPDSHAVLVVTPPAYACKTWPIATPPV